MNQLRFRNISIVVQLTHKFLVRFLILIILYKSWARQLSPSCGMPMPFFAQRTHLQYFIKRTQTNFGVSITDVSVSFKHPFIQSTVAEYIMRIFNGIFSAYT